MGLYSLMGDFLPISTCKYITNIKNTIGAKKREPVGMNLSDFSAAKEVCNKLQNKATFDSTVFKTNPEKSYFSYTFYCSKQLQELERTIFA